MSWGLIFLAELLAKVLGGKQLRFHFAVVGFQQVLAGHRRKLAQRLFKPQPKVHSTVSPGLQHGTAACPRPDLLLGASDPLLFLRLVKD